MCFECFLIPSKISLTKWWTLASQTNHFLWWVVCLFKATGVFCTWMNSIQPYKIQRFGKLIFEYVWRLTWKNSMQPCKIQSCVDLVFEGWQKETDVSDFVKQEFGSLQNAKVWEVDFWWFLNMFEWTAFNPYKIKKLAIVQFWRMILAKFWSRSCRSNLACFSFCKGHQIQMSSEKWGRVLDFCRDWIFINLLFLRSCSWFCKVPGATFSICGL